MCENRCPWGQNHKPCSQCGDGDLCYQRAKYIGNIHDNPELLEVEHT